LAQVQLNPNLRPDNAATIPIGNTGNKADTVNVVLELIAGSLIYLAGPVAVLMIAIGGLRYVISHGDQNQMDEAKKNITWAIIGLIVIVLSWAIMENIIRIIGSSTG
jgi:hypothetical protein